MTRNLRVQPPAPNESVSIRSKAESSSPYQIAPFIKPNPYSCIVTTEVTELNEERKRLKLEAKEAIEQNKKSRRLKLYHDKQLQTLLYNKLQDTLFKG
jgi:hypothetical protein